jgi:putative transcriptional regulator
MTPKRKAGNRILEAVHETARDLHAAGFIDRRRMHQYDALCMAPVPNYSSRRIRALRKRHRGWRQ